MDAVKTRAKWVVERRETDDFSEVKVYGVGRSGEPRWQYVNVWASRYRHRDRYTGKVSWRWRTNCTDCQGTLTAMKETCAHARAVKRHLLKA